MQGMNDKVRVRGFRKPRNHRFCELSVADSMESNLTMDGLKSSMRMYWDPSSTLWDLLDMWLTSST